MTFTYTIPDPNDTSAPSDSEETTDTSDETVDTDTDTESEDGMQGNADTSGTSETFREPVEFSSGGCGSSVRPMSVLLLAVCALAALSAGRKERRK